MRTIYYTSLIGTVYTGAVFAPGSGKSESQLSPYLKSLWNDFSLLLKLSTCHYFCTQKTTIHCNEHYYASLTRKTASSLTEISESESSCDPVIRFSLENVFVKFGKSKLNERSFRTRTGIPSPTVNYILFAATCTFGHTPCLFLYCSGSVLNQQTKLLVVLAMRAFVSCPLWKTTAPLCKS